MSSKGKRGLCKALCMLTALIMVLGVIPAAFTQNTFAEDEKNTGKEKYDEIMGMSDAIPLDWDDEKDPYGYGKNVEFMLMSLDELFAYKTNSEGQQYVYSYDKLKAKNTGEPLAVASDGKTTKYDAGNNYLTHAQSIAFDPTGSGRKDHVAVIGVYEYDDEAYIELRVMDNKGNWSPMVDVGKCTWMINYSSLNNDQMWDFNAMNFLDITAGDYDNDGKDTLAIWAFLDDGEYGLFEFEPFTGTYYTSDPSDMTNLIAHEYTSYRSKRRDNNGTPISYYAMIHDKYPSIYKAYVDDGGDTDYVDNKLCCDLDTGDLNGDGIDDLVALSYVGNMTSHKNMRKKVTDLYRPIVAVHYGGASGNIASDYSVRTPIWEKDKNDSSKYIAPLAAGLAVGDIDGNGIDEIVVSGFKNTIEGKSGSTVEDQYDPDSSYLVTAILNASGGELGMLMFDSSTTTNKWTRGGSTYGGLYLSDSSTGDQIWQRTGVETVAFNGKGSAETIFINGDLYTYKSGRISAVYQPDFFKRSPRRWNDIFVQETYFRSIAVGNFDNNDMGREQIVYVLGSADANNVGDVMYMTGMIGGLYVDENGQPSLTAKDYYTTSYSYSGADDDSLRHDFYPDDNGANCEPGDGLNFTICAWDNDSDGLLAKYVEKAYTYTDPEVIAIIQGPPVFSELAGTTSGASTSYTISTDYNFDKSSSDSVSFGINGVFNLDVDVFQLNVEAGYALDWSESFSRGYEEGKEYTFTTDGDDLVVVRRIPVTVYTYQVQANGSYSDDNIITLSFPGEAAYADMTVDDYNAFVNYYNQECKRLYEEAVAKGDPWALALKSAPSMKTIDDKWLGHPGDPLSYMMNTSVQNGRTVLQDTALTFGVAPGSTSFSWSASHSVTEEETMAHGFNFDLTAIGGSKSVKGGVHTSLNYMHETATSKSRATGQGASCEIGNISTALLEEKGIALRTAQQYGFQYQMVTWPSALTTITPNEDDIMDPTVEEDDIRMEVTQVPIYGYMLTGVSAAVPPVTDLDSEFITNDDDEMQIRLTWSDPGTAKNPVGAYALYQIQKDGTFTKIDTLPAGTQEFVFDGLDGRDYYSFVIRTLRSLNTTIESVDSNITYLYLDVNAIYAIELTEENDQYDIYTITHTDGSTSEITVRHGIGIKNVSLSDKGGDDGVTDTYTITFTDNSTVSFTVRNGRDSHQIELRTVEKTDPESGDMKNMVQWRYIAQDGENQEDFPWSDLIAVTDAEFVKGQDGREIELRVQNGSVEWRYSASDGQAASEWKALISLSELTGAKGDKGDKGETGDPGKDGREVELRKQTVTDPQTSETVEMIQWRYTDEDDNAWRDLVAADSSAILKGEAGADGREIELQIDPEKGELQWRYKAAEADAEEDWQLLIKLDELKGDAGADGKDGADGANGADGKDGRQIELMYDGTTRSLQWRYAASEDEDQEDFPWIQLVMLSSDNVLKGEKGDPGADGKDGVDGKDGADGKDGIDGKDGVNGINGKDGADGKDGVNGIDGKDGQNGADGKDGAQGQAGVPGKDGIDGKDGKDGKDGLNGRDGVDGANGKDGKDGKDGRGIQDVKVSSDGSLIVTLTDGTVINAGKVFMTSEKTETAITKSGSVHNYYFNVTYDEFEKITVDGKEVPADEYTVTKTGDGVLVTISDEAVPLSSKSIIAEGTSTVDSVSLTQTANSASSSVPWWALGILGVWNAGLTANAVIKGKKKKDESV